MCSFCLIYPKSIQHIFSEYEKSVNYGQHWITSKVHITLSKSMKILGYLQNDAHFWPLNFVLVLTRSDIFQSSRKNTSLNIFALQVTIKRKYLEQQMLHRITGKENLFAIKWVIWNNLFRGI